jgi:hypothetical protein
MPWPTSSWHWPAPPVIPATSAQAASLLAPGALSPTRQPPSAQRPVYAVLGPLPQGRQPSLRVAGASVTRRGSLVTGYQGAGHPLPAPGRRGPGTGHPALPPLPGRWPLGTGDASREREFDFRPGRWGRATGDRGLQRECPCTTGKFSTYCKDADKKLRKIHQTKSVRLLTAVARAHAPCDTVEIPQRLRDCLMRALSQLLAEYAQRLRIADSAPDTPATL